MRVLLTGWPSFVHGEATAGDVLSMDAVAGTLAGAGVAYDVAWSPVFRPGGLALEDAAPEGYTHVVFACGPAHGEQVRYLHRRYARCRRIAVGVSVIDPADPAVTGFHVVSARDGDSGAPRKDLSAAAWSRTLPVVGVVLAPGQGEYGTRRRHADATDRLTAWLDQQDCARLPLDTRLDPREWRRCATADEFTSLLGRVDAVLTMRLHGLVLALRHGVPALAVDPVAGGAKVSAQAAAWDWPAVVAARDACGSDSGSRLQSWFDWCLSGAGRSAAQRCRAGLETEAAPLLRSVLDALGTPLAPISGTGGRTSDGD